MARPLAVAFFLLLGYVSAYAAVHPFVGASATVLAIIPSVFGGALLGLRWGLAISLASAGSTALLWLVFGDVPGSVILRVGGGLGMVAMIAVATGVGHLRDLDRQTILRLRERDELVARLRGSEELLAAVTGHLPVVILAFDPAGTIWRSEGIGLSRLGLAVGSQDGRSLYELCLTADDQAAVRAAIAGGSGSAAVELAGTKLQLTCAPTRDRSGALTGGIAIGLADGSA